MTESILLHKVHANGADYLVHVAKDEDAAICAPETVAQWCHRRTGIGASGFVQLTPTTAPEHTAEQVHWQLQAYRPDGSPQPVNGDELRAAARILIDEGHVELAPAETLPILTVNGIHDVQPNGSGGFQLDLGRWRLIQNEPTLWVPGLDVPRPGLEIELAGSRVIVIALAHADELAAVHTDTAPTIEPEPVDLPTIAYVVPDEPLVRDSVGWLRMRAWQPVSGSTDAGGTAAAATALAVRYWAGSDAGNRAPNHWRVTTDGGPLQVRMFPTEEGEHLGLAGRAERVFDTRVTLPQGEPR